MSCKKTESIIEGKQGLILLLILIRLFNKKII